MPEEGVAPLRHEDILSYEEILDFVQTAVGLGVDKVRVTGGEPLVRAGLVAFIARLSQIQGLQDLSLTTNATLLPRFADSLKQAGLHRINISLDTMDPTRYAELTRRGSLEDAIEGIETALRVGFDPIKLNCVVDASRDEPDAKAVAEFATKHGIEVRFIPKMDIPSGRFGRVDGGSGGHCAGCNRLRLSADGFLRPCLFSDLAYDVRSGSYEEVIRQAVREKPEQGAVSIKNRMNRVGG
jgi:GTP 3',8-cyclase